MPNIAYLDFKYERTTTMEGVYDNAFTITSLEDNNTIAFNQDLSNAGFIYSLDGGMSWQPVSSATICTLDAGESVMIRNTSPILEAFNCPWPRLFSTEMKNFNVSGNIMSLLTEDYKNFNSLHYVDEEEDIDFYFDNILQYVFSGTNVVDASNLILPATELAAKCYYRMFWNCTKLETAPKLPSTHLAGWCYANMFEGCTSLKECPALPATLLPSYCYACMFGICTSLVATPEFPDFELKEGDTNQLDAMFENCTSIISGPVLSCDTLTENCYIYMFSGCTSMVNPPVLKATNLAEGCYYDMFEGCTSLTYAPDLPANILPEMCYAYMFRNCSNLSYINISALIREENSLYNWVEGVAPTGVFVKIPNVTYPIDNISGVPIGWTIYESGDNVLDLYAVSLSVDPDGAGTVSGAGRYMRSKNVTVSAFPENDYMFDHWEVNGINVSNEQIYTFVMNYDIHLTAKFVVDTNEYANAYFTIESLTKNNKIYIRTYETDDPFKIYYKINDSWNSLDVINPRDEDILITTLNNHDTLCLASNKQTWHVPNSISTGARIITTGNYMVYGNLLSMTLYDEEAENDPDIFEYDIYHEVPDNCFQGFFAGSSSNISKLLNAINLVLSAYTVGSGSYAYMFRNCTKLIYAPKRIYASTLDSYCYYEMFYGCASLITVPVLNAVTLEFRCYAGMFGECLSLTKAPTLPATTMAEACYEGMFYGCTSLTTAPALPATTLADNCYCDMFDGCTSLINAPVLPATQAMYGCYEYMFADCTSLTTPPALPATTIASSCYEGMFTGCTALTTAPALPATTLSIYCYRDMFYGCTSLTTAPDLLAEVLVQGCYARMFYDCENLNYIRILALSRATNDTYNWVHNVAPSGIFMKDYNTEYPIDDDSGVPIGWTIIDDESSHIFYNVRIINSHPTLGDVFGGGRYESGTTASVRAVPASGHSFKNWKYNGVILSTNSEFSFTVTQDVTLVVTWDIEHIYENEYLTVESLSDDNRIYITCQAGKMPATVQYCINDDLYWTTYTINDSSTLNAEYVCILNEGDRIKLKNVQYTNPFTQSDTYWARGISIGNTKYVNVYGNIMSLYEAHLNNEQSTITHYVGRNLSVLSSNERFSGLFRDDYEWQSGGISYHTVDEYGNYNFNPRSSHIVSAKNLIMPATTLTIGCYAWMFDGCRDLLDLPELPATTLAAGCYYNMFHRCTSLPSISSNLLPATTLATSCYAEMFAECASLVSIPSGLLPATTLANGCYQGMFRMMQDDLNPYHGLLPTALTTIPSGLLPATTLAQSCYMQMFAGCTSLVNVPSDLLPATGLPTNCYHSMFLSCTSMTTAPDLPATVFYNDTTEPYGEMFTHCTSLNYVKAMFKYAVRGEDASSGTVVWTYNWLDYVASSGTFVRNPDANMNRIPIGPNGIPSGWTIQIAS